MASSVRGNKKNNDACARGEKKAGASQKSVRSVSTRSTKGKKKGTTKKMPARIFVAVCFQKILSSLNLLKICRKLRDQRSSSVEMNMQYCYLAVVEYRNAKEYIDSPELSEEFAKFKAELKFNTQPPTAPKKSLVA